MLDNNESTDIIPSVESDHSAIKIKLCSLHKVQGDKSTGNLIAR